MKQIFIRIAKENGDFYNKDIRDATYDERMAWYQRLSKGQLCGLLEKVGGFDK